MQYAPASILSKIIKHYLVFDIPKCDDKKFRHFSNCHNGLVFTLKKRDFVALSTGEEVPEAFVFGQISENQDFHISGTTSIVIVLFQPLGFYGLTGIHANKHIDDITDACPIFGKEILKLQEGLQRLSSQKEIIASLNSFFIEKLNKISYSPNPELLDVVALAHQTRGAITVGKLCSQTGIQERKMQRMFAEQIGVSPKKFVRNVKLHSFLDLLRNKIQNNSLTQLSMEAGYYDQAHAIKEFRKTVGLNPSSYIRKRRLAVNLVEL